MTPKVKNYTATTTKTDFPAIWAGRFVIESDAKNTDFVTIYMGTETVVTLEPGDSYPDGVHGYISRYSHQADSGNQKVIVRISL